MAPLDGLFPSMEASSHVGYPGAREFTEEGYAMDACSGTKTAKSSQEKSQVKMPEI